MSAQAQLPLSVLVVDDDARPRAVVAGLLKTRKHRVTEAKSGNEAIELLKQRPVDLVVTDINMPDGTGVDLLRWIKAADCQAPSVLFITALEDISTPDALGLGATDLIMKPLDRDAFLDAVDKAGVRPVERWSSAGPIDEIFPYHIETEFESLDEACASGVVELGQGGMFLELDAGYPLSYERIRFSLSFTSGPLRSLVGDGLVRWARPHGAPGLKNGIGVEFRFIAPECRSELTRRIVSERIAAFIPVGAST